MMPVVRISEANFRKLQQLAVPLTDNPDTIIGRLADAALASTVYQVPKIAQTPSVALEQEAAGEDPSEPLPHEDLTHTSVISASFAGRPVRAPRNWTNFQKLAHEVAFEKLGSLSELYKASHAQLRDGEYEDNGYSPIPKVGASIRGDNANKAWANICHLARKLGVSVEAVIEWPDKPNAARPGQTQSLVWPPH